MGKSISLETALVWNMPSTVLFWHERLHLILQTLLDTLPLHRLHRLQSAGLIGHNGYDKSCVMNWGPMPHCLQHAAWNNYWKSPHFLIFCNGIPCTSCLTPQRNSRRCKVECQAGTRWRCAATRRPAPTARVATTAPMHTLRKNLSGESAAIYILSTSWNPTLTWSYVTL